MEYRRLFEYIDDSVSKAQELSASNNSVALEELWEALLNLVSHPETLIRSKSLVAIRDVVKSVPESLGVCGAQLTSLLMHEVISSMQGDESTENRIAAVQICALIFQCQDEIENIHVMSSDLDICEYLFMELTGIVARNFNSLVHRHRAWTPAPVHDVLVNVLDALTLSLPHVSRSTSPSVQNGLYSLFYMGFYVMREIDKERISPFVISQWVRILIEGDSILFPELIAFVPIIERVINMFSGSDVTQYAVHLFSCWIGSYTMMDGLEIRRKQVSLFIRGMKHIKLFLGPTIPIFSEYDEILKECHLEKREIDAAMRTRIERFRQSLHMPGTVVALHFDADHHTFNSGDSQQEIVDVSQLKIPIPAIQKNACVKLAVQLPRIAGVPPGHVTFPPVISTHSTIGSRLIQHEHEVKGVLEWGYSPAPQTDLPVIAVSELDGGVFGLSICDEILAKQIPDRSFGKYTGSRTPLGFLDAPYFETPKVTAPTVDTQQFMSTSNLTNIPLPIASAFHLLPRVQQSRPRMLQANGKLELWVSTPQLITRSYLHIVEITETSEVVIPETTNWEVGCTVNMTWSENEVRKRAKCVITAILHDDDGLPIWGSQQLVPLDTSAVCAGVAADSKPFFALPIHFPPFPSKYDPNGIPYYSGPGHLFPLAAVCEDGRPLYIATGEHVDLLNSSPVPVGYTNSGCPIYLPAGATIPKPCGYTSLGLPYYSLYQIALDETQPESDLKWKIEDSGIVADSCTNTGCKIDVEAFSFRNSFTDIQILTGTLTGAPGTIFVVTSPFGIFQTSVTVLTHHATSSIFEIPIKFNPMKHPIPSSQVMGELRAISSTGTILATCSLIGLKGPVIRVEPVERLWVEPNDRSILRVEIVNLMEIPMGVEMSLITDSCFTLEQHKMTLASQLSGFATVHFIPNDNRGTHRVSLELKTSSGEVHTVPLEAFCGISMGVRQASVDELKISTAHDELNTSHVTQKDPRLLLQKKPTLQSLNSNVRVNKLSNVVEKKHSVIRYLYEGEESVCSQECKDSIAQMFGDQKPLVVSDNSNISLDDVGMVLDFGILDPLEKVRRIVMLDNLRDKDAYICLEGDASSLFSFPSHQWIPANSSAPIQIYATGNTGYTGPLTLVLTIHSSLSRSPLYVKLTAFFGRAIEFPVSPLAYFPIRLPNETSTIEVPLMNHSQYALEVKLMGPLKTGFTASMDMFKLDPFSSQMVTFCFTGRLKRGVTKCPVCLFINSPYEKRYFATGNQGFFELVGITMEAMSSEELGLNCDLNQINDIIGWTKNSFKACPKFSQDNIAGQKRKRLRRFEMKLTDNSKMAKMSSTTKSSFRFLNGFEGETLDGIHFIFPETLKAVSLMNGGLSIKPKSELKLEFISCSKAPLSLSFLSAIRSDIVSENHHFDLVGATCLCWGVCSYDIYPKTGFSNILDYQTCLVGQNSSRSLSIVFTSMCSMKTDWKFEFNGDDYGYQPFEASLTHGSLESFQSQVVFVSFAPEAEGSYRESFTINVFSGELKVCSHTVALVGQGRVAEVEGLPDHQEVLDFGNIYVSRFAEREFCILNRSSTPEKFLIMFPPHSKFTCIPNTFTISGRKSRKLKIGFSSNESGFQIGEMFIFYASRILKVHLNGRSGETKLSISTNMIDLEDSFVGMKSVANVFVSNVGTLPLTMSSILNTFHGVEIAFKGVLHQPNLRLSATIKRTTNFWIVLKDNLKLAVRRCVDSIPIMTMEYSVSEFLKAIKNQSPFFKSSKYAKASTIQNKSSEKIPKLEPGKSFHFEISFQPTKSVKVRGDILFRHHVYQSEAITTAYSIGEITGIQDPTTEDIAPLRIRAVGSRRLIVDPIRLNFGFVASKQYAGSNFPGAILKVAVENMSKQTQTIRFDRSTNLCFDVSVKNLVLRPGERKHLPVVFTPRSAGVEYSGQVYLEDRFREHCISVFGIGACASVRADTDRLSFTSMKQGTPQYADIWLHNTGDLLSAFQVSFDNDAFELVGGTAGMVPARGSICVRIKCSVGTRGTQCTLAKQKDVIVGNAYFNWEIVPQGAIETIKVDTLAEFGDICLGAQVEYVNFGICTLNYPSYQTVTLTNTGSSDCEWEVVHLSKHFQIHPESGGIQRHGSMELNICLNSSVCDFHREVLILNSDGGTIKITVEGVIMAPQLLLPKSLSIHFGTILYGDKVRRELVLENTGKTFVDYEIHISSKDITIPSNSDELSVEAGCFSISPASGSVEPGESLILYVVASLAEYESSIDLNVFAATWALKIKQIEEPWKGDLKCVGGFSSIQTSVSNLIWNQIKDRNEPNRVLHKNLYKQTKAMLDVIGKIENVQAVNIFYFGSCMVDLVHKHIEAFTLTNSGSVRLTFAVELKTGDDVVFNVSPMNGSLEPGHQCSFSAMCFSKLIGFGQCPVFIKCRSNLNPEKVLESKVLLCANTGTCKLTCDSSSIDFGKCLVGKKQVKSFMLKSSGSHPVTWKAQLSVNEQPTTESINSNFQLDVYGGTIQCQDDQVVTVTYTPDEGVSNICVLVSWSPEDKTVLYLSGEGAKGHLEWHLVPEEGTPQFANTIDFGYQPCYPKSAHSWRTIVLANTGTLDLHVEILCKLPTDAFVVCFEREAAASQLKEWKINRFFDAMLLEEDADEISIELSRTTALGHTYKARNDSHSGPYILCDNLLLEADFSTQIHIAFSPGREENFDSVLHVFNVEANSDTVIQVKGTGGKLNLELEKMESFGVVGFAYDTLRRITCRNTGSLSSPLVMTMVPSDFKDVITLLRSDACTESNFEDLHLAKREEQRVSSSSVLCETFIDGNSQIEFYVCLNSKFTGKGSGRIVFTPTLPGLPIDKDLNLLPVFKSKTKKVVNVNPFSIENLFSFNVVNNRLRLNKMSQFGFGRVVLNSQFSETRKLLNPTLGAVVFDVKLVGSDASCWSISPANGKIEPNESIDLVLEYTSRDDNFDNWHNISVVLLNHGTGRNDFELGAKAAVGFPRLKIENLESGGMVDFKYCQVESYLTVKLRLSNVGTGILHLFPSVEPQDGLQESPIFLGWSQFKKVDLAMSVGKEERFKNYAMEEIGLKHGDGKSEGVINPQYFGYGVLGDHDILDLYLVFYPRTIGSFSCGVNFRTSSGNDFNFAVAGESRDYRIIESKIPKSLLFGSCVAGNFNFRELHLSSSEEQEVPICLSFSKERDENLPPPLGVGGVLSPLGGTMKEEEAKVPLLLPQRFFQVNSQGIVAETQIALCIKNQLSAEDAQELIGLVADQPREPNSMHVPLYIHAPGNTLYTVDVSYRLELPRILVVLKEKELMASPVQVVRKKRRQSLSNVDTANDNVAAVIKFGDISLYKKYTGSLVLESNSDLEIPFTAKVYVEGFQDSSHFFKLSVMKGNVSKRAKKTISVSCNFRDGFDSEDNHVCIKLNYLYGKLPEVVVPIIVHTVESIFNTDLMNPILLEDPVFLGFSFEKVLKLENVSGREISAELLFPCDSFSTTCKSVLNIPVDGQVEVPILFQPVREQNYNSTLNIKVDELHFSVGLCGVGCKAAVKVFPSSRVDFGFVGVSLVHRREITIQNPCMLPLLVYFRDQGECFSVIPDRFTIDKKGSQTVQVVFAPTEESLYESFVTICVYKEDAVVTKETIPMLESPVEIIGYGGRVALEVPPVVDFGRISMHIRQMTSIQVTNTGDVPMDVTVLTPPASVTGVVTVSPCSLSLLPTQSISVRVVITLSEEADQEFVLKIVPTEGESYTSSWEMKVIGYGDKIELSENLVQILQDEQLQILDPLSSDFHDGHIAKVLEAFVYLPQVSNVDQLLVPIEPFCEVERIHFPRPVPVLVDMKIPLIPSRFENRIQFVMTDDHQYRDKRWAKLLKESK